MPPAIHFCDFDILIDVYYGILTNAQFSCKYNEIPEKMRNFVPWK